jgi:hypothetical protein
MNMQALHLVFCMFFLVNIKRMNKIYFLIK